MDYLVLGTREAGQFTQEAMASPHFEANITLCVFRVALGQKTQKYSR